MKLQRITKRVFAAAIALASLTAFADGWYPSPTGWRGPIREAGRPWLAGYAYPSAAYPSYYYPNNYSGAGYSYYGQASYYPTVTYSFAPNTWYFDQNSGQYWYYDSSARLFWYYNLQTRGYYYAAANG